MIKHIVSWLRRGGGLMVSVVNSGSDGSGSRPSRVCCAVFLDKTLSLTVPLFTLEYKWVPATEIVGAKKKKPKTELSAWRYELAWFKRL